MQKDATLVHKKYAKEILKYRRSRKKKF
jgi:hypothetical protein